MPKFVLEDQQRRQLVFEGDEPPTAAIAEEAFAKVYSGEQKQGGAPGPTMRAADPYDPIDSFLGSVKGQLRALKDKGLIAQSQHITSPLKQATMTWRGIQDALRESPDYTKKSWQGSILRTLAPTQSDRVTRSIFEPGDDETFALPKPEDLPSDVAEAIATTAGAGLQFAARRAGMSRERLGRAVYAPVAGLQRFMVSPGGLLTGMSMGAVGAAGMEPASAAVGQAAQRAVSGFFAIDMANAASEQAALAEEKFRQGDKAAALEHAIGAFSSAAFAVGAAKHATQKKAPANGAQLAEVLAADLEAANSPMTAAVVRQTSGALVTEQPRAPVRMTPPVTTGRRTIADKPADVQIGRETAEQQAARLAATPEPKPEEVIPSAPEERIEPSDIRVQPEEAARGGLPEETGVGSSLRPETERVAETSPLPALAPEAKPPEQMTPEEWAQSATLFHGGPERVAAFSLEGKKPATLGGFAKFGVSFGDRKTAERYAHDFGGATPSVTPARVQSGKSVTLSAADFETLQRFQSIIDSGKPLSETQDVSLELKLKDAGLDYVIGESPISAFRRNGITIINKQAGRGGAEAETLVLDTGLIDTHDAVIQRGLSENRTVSAVAADAYGIKLPAGWTREGDLYVPPKDAPVPKPASPASERGAYSPPDAIKVEGKKSVGSATAKSDGTRIFLFRKYGKDYWVGDGETFRATKNEAYADARRLRGLSAPKPTAPQPAVGTEASPVASKPTTEPPRAEAPTQPKAKTDAFDDWLTRSIDNLAPGKGDTFSDPLFLQAVGRPLLRSALQVIRSAYRGGKAIAEAVEDGIRWLKEQGKEFDEAEMRNWFQRLLSADTHEAALKELETPVPPVIEAKTPEALETAMRAKETAPATPSVGIRREAIAAQREARGEDVADIPALAEPEPQARLDAAVARMKDDPSAAERLVDELSAKPRALNPDEVALLRVRQVDLDREYTKAVEAGEAASKSGDAEAIRSASERVQFWKDKLSQLEIASRAAGSFWHQTGVAMQAGLREDYTLTGLRRKAQAAKGWEPLSEAEEAEIKDLHAQLTKATDDLAAAQEAKSKAEADLAIEKARMAVLPFDKRVLALAEQWVAKREVTANRYVQEVFGVAWSPTPDLLAKTAFIGMTRMARGIVELGKWTDDLVRILGTETFRPYAEQVWKESRKLLDEELAADAAQPATAKGSQAVKKKLSAQERIADATTTIREIGPDGDWDAVFAETQKLVRALVEADPKITRDALIDFVQETLKSIYPDITRLEAMDAISGRGRFSVMPQDVVSKTLRDYKAQIRLLGHQADVEAGRPLPKTGLQRDPMSPAARAEQQKLDDLKHRFGVVVTDPAKQLASLLQARKTSLRHRMEDLRREIQTRQRRQKAQNKVKPDAELLEMQRELAELQQEHEAVFGKRELTEAQRLQLAIQAAERSDAAWQQRLADAKKGIFTSARKKGFRVANAQLAAIRARTEAAREEVKALEAAAKPKTSPLELALRQTKIRRAKQLATLLDKMAREDFSKRPKRQRLEDEGLLMLEGKLEETKERAAAMQARLEFEAMTPFRKALRLSANAYDAGRMLMTTGEGSVVLRQGKPFVMSHPIRAARAVREGVRAFLNEDVARAAELRIRKHPDYRESQEAGLHISREGDPLTRQEEFFMGRWARSLGFKGVRPIHAFNRAAVTFLNQARWEYWQAMRNSMSRGGKPTALESKMYARYANEATGRGSLGALERHAVLLGRVAFAPRYLASRFQYAAFHALWQGTTRSRAVISLEYARSIIGWVIYNNLLLLGLQMMRDDDEKPVKRHFDWRSSDFGKEVIGRTRLDTMTGFAQLATFAGRTWTGETKPPGKAAVPIRGEKVPYGRGNWWGVFGRFVGSKAHPVPLAIGNLFAGVDLFGNETSLATEMGKLGGPMTYVDIYQALRAEGLDEGAALGVLAFFGEGLQTYKARKK